MSGAGTGTLVTVVPTDNNLLGIRQKFIELSGRINLASTAVTDYDTDAGADFFIRGGSLDLDLEQDNLMSWAEHQEALAIGEYDIQIDYCKNVQEAYYLNADGKMMPLTKKSYNYLIDEYPELGNTDSGAPLYWAPYPTRRVPAQIISGRAVNVISVMIMPPTDEAITVSLYTKSYSYPLTDNDDENFWSLNFPHILILAALRNLEGFYRNTQGYKDYDAIIDAKLIGLDKDLAEWAAAGSDLAMEG